MHTRFIFVADASKVSRGQGNGSTPFAVVDNCSEETFLTWGNQSISIKTSSHKNPQMLLSVHQNNYQH